MGRSIIREEILQAFWNTAMRIGAIDPNGFKFVDGNREYFRQLEPPHNTRKSIGLSLYTCIPKFAGSFAESLLLHVKQTNKPCSVQHVIYDYGPRRGMTEWSILFVPVTTRTGRPLIVDLSNEASVCQPSNLGLLHSCDIAAHLFHRMGLTSRQIDVIRARLQGKSSKEIAEWLGISFFTVRRHIEVCYEKLGVHSFQELVGKLSAELVPQSGPAEEIFR